MIFAKIKVSVEWAIPPYPGFASLRVFQKSNSITRIFTAGHQVQMPNFLNGYLFHPHLIKALICLFFMKLSLILLYITHANSMKLN